MMTIEKRLERLEAILDARGLDWDHPRVEEGPANEPPKKWRILEPGEVVQEGDWVNAKDNKPDEDPPGGGWMPAVASVIGGEASQAMGLYVARPVADEPAKEPEHPAGPKPDPGEGYRILSKNPPEELMPGDELQYINGTWVASDNARTHRRQGLSLWYRRKIEPAEPAEPEYREPVLPADAGKLCEFSNDEKIWLTGRLRGYANDLWQSFLSSEVGAKVWVHARIKKDA